MSLLNSHNEELGGGVGGGADNRGFSRGGGLMKELVVFDNCFYDYFMIITVETTESFLGEVFLECGVF